MSATAVDFSCQHPDDMEPPEAPKGATPLTPLSDQEAYEKLKDTVGRFRTQSLFWEYRNPNYPAPFTLKDVDHEGALSMYQIYMAIGDPTEYTQAIHLLGSWRHWEALTACTWFKPHINRWRNEMRVKFESDRFREMERVAEEQKGTPQGVAATKWLAERYSSVQKPKPKRGRPSKDEKNALLRDQVEEDKLLKEEAERIGI